MDGVARMLAAAAAAALLFGLRQLSRRRDWPPPPLRLPLLALVSWVLEGPATALAGGGSPRPWLDLADDLLLSYAGLALLLWLGLELPGGLGWWRRPPQLLLQLLMLGLGTAATVVLVRQTTRFDLVGLVTTSAVLTAVIGLAAQETLKDLFAGLELQLGQEVQAGDWLELGEGVQGTVTAITWRDTTLRTMEGCLLVVPNSRVCEGVITNRSAEGVASNRFEVGLDYDFPPAQARQLLLDTVQQHPLVLEHPAPRVRLRQFGDSAIVYDVQVWQQEANLRAVLELRSDLLEQIWYALQRAGQSIPFPVRDVQPRRRRTSDDGPSADASGLLDHCQLFGALSPEERQRLAAGSHCLTYGPGEAIVREGERGDCLYLLLAGEVEVIKQLGGGPPRPIRRLQAGAVFGEMTLFLDAPRSATVRACAECRLLQVERSSLQGLMAANPALLEQLAALVANRQAELDQLSASPQPGGAPALLETMRRLFRLVRGG
jgi:CRP-like cAMP-binding protein